MDDSQEKLGKIRRQIDEVDRKLLQLFNRRANLAREVAEIKGDSRGAMAYYHPDREAGVLRRLVAANEGPLSDEEAARLFREVMSACRALQTPMSIAFLGPQGTFTEAAALKHFGHSVHTGALDTVDAVFREVESGASDYGIVPVENSTEGMVTHTLDMFTRSPLAICGEVQLRIHHYLLSKSEGIATVQRVYSHQQSLAQCRKWLDTNMPAVERLTVNSNAEAAFRASREPGTAAIAGETAASHYELQILAANIEDEPDNTTRFLVIGRSSVAPTGRDKTSLLLSAKNVPGALYGLLEPFSRRGISMTRIESRPSRSGLWEYVFFVDIEGHACDANVAEALAEIEERASLFKVLGSYPRAVL
ncbi:MAG: prephenate dehydratase [Gammaproteobacteria bacterium]|nr:prephenate dehydratase [Gammaproteobacteria bacterium]NIR82477.1 prephenate dehydratase [Gammaproteobacteria bacterium]NIR88473.1 prephenate dehydratase [Gammaproteobacteria bacterium]NIU03613.1 prephenate dehydratase [Gammaproteobacteria bacterium]NIV50965.1 prephenate dehydratase [Gammaproteobacteria bacterium]